MGTEGRTEVGILRQDNAFLIANECLIIMFKVRDYNGSVGGPFWDSVGVDKYGSFPIWGTPQKGTPVFGNPLFPGFPWRASVLRSCQ